MYIHKKKKKYLFQVKFVQKTRRRLRAINVKAVKARRRITCAKVNRLFVILIACIFIYLFINICFSHVSRSICKEFYIHVF